MSDYEPCFGGEVRKTSETGGQKGDKLARFDLIPVRPLWHVAEVYGAGARKYADRNWEQGYDWHLSFAAMIRHAFQFWGGEWLDPETKVPHLASVVFHAFTLMEFAETHPEFDDRPKRHVKRNPENDSPTTVAAGRPAAATVGCQVCGDRKFWENREFH